MSNPRRNCIRLLAEAFKAEMLKELGPEKLRQAVSRNAVGGHDKSDAVCCTNDFCDGNMVMDAAFKRVMGYPPLVFERLGEEAAEVESMTIEDTYLWNSAWTIAKMEGFKPKK